MKRFYLWRTNLKNLENYHSITNLKDFKKYCWDQYLLQSLWFLENNIFDEVIIWRLSDNNIPDIVFEVGNKKFIQRWVRDFNSVFSYPSPDISFFRGGFPEYDNITKQKPDFFGLKLYLGASKRTNPQYGGIYDKILVEYNNHITTPIHIPYYKTAPSEIFHPLNSERQNDLCWICNFTQIKHKGQEFFISNISKSEYLKSLKIVHCGNKPEVGKEMCKKYGISNIEFLGHLQREKINEVLNRSKYGIVTSNEEDGNPRIITEILMSGTPLLIRDRTRVLYFYKEKDTIEFNDSNIENRIKLALSMNFKVDTNRLSLDNVCKLNIEQWKIK